jgi:membrane protein DedA with SNARE-associated domain
MPIRWRFVGYTLLGSSLWSGSLIVLGWILGREWELVERYASIISFAVLATLILGFLWLSWRRKERP